MRKFIHVACRSIYCALCKANKDDSKEFGSCVSCRLLGQCLKNTLKEKDLFARIDKAMFE
jgi:hypothetical protein